MNKKICEMVANRVLEEMKKGVIPWQKPWFGTNNFVSHVTGRHYSLLNCILLGVPGEYATFKQVVDEGGKVKKGAKSKFVVFWSKKEKVVEDENGEEQKRVYWILRYYNVFNLDDCEGISKKYVKDEKFEHDKIGEAESVVSGYCDSNPGLKIIRDEESDRAFYRPSEDMIQVPMIGQFAKVEEFYSTLFHEMTHSTGHWSRLGRFKEDVSLAAFGSEDYSKEELVAELGAAALCGYCGIESSSSFKNSVAYLDGWMRAIEENPELIVAAAGKADKAVSFILGEVE